MRFLVLFRDEKTTNEMVRLLESPDLAARVGMPPEMMISAVGFQCMEAALIHMGLRCRSCVLHRNSDIGFEFILVDDFFLDCFEKKLRLTEALVDDKRFANSLFRHFKEEELSTFKQIQIQDVAADVVDDAADADAAMRERLVYLIRDAIAH